MCRSSRIPSLLILALSTTATAAQAGQVGGTQYAQSGYIAAPGVDLGLDLATSLAGAGVPFAPDAVPPQGPYGPPLEQPPLAGPGFFAGPPPCIRPKIIQVGRGLKHAVKTKVIYGASAC